ncbi:hypothetical protein C9439_06220 [archaeon SCG-AAA382B04]|nr:hypothetical protein C9439_06220 [archaeon SCG-AAA382B04]
MVSLGKRGQVILLTSIVIALIILSLSTVLYTQTTSKNNYINSKSNRGDYIYYNIRNSYRNILEESETVINVSNPFNTTVLRDSENQLNDLCSRNGYLVSFQNKSYNSTSQLAKVTIVFSGENLKYHERIKYDLS